MIHLTSEGSCFGADLQSVLHDCKPFAVESGLPRRRRALELPLYIAALVLVLLSVFGMLLWPTWSERERRRRRAIVDALTGDE